MKIVGVKVLEFRRPLDARTWNPTFRWHERRAPLLVIETDEGLTGVGEAWSRQPQINLVLDALAEHYAPALLGSDPLARASIARRLGKHAPFPQPWAAAAAASAVDIALWDLTAQAARQPLWRALGGSRSRTPVYASGGLYRDGSTLSDLASEFEAYVALGFTRVKMKIGALPLEGDLERVRSVRSAVGDDVVLWVDAVNQLSRPVAPAWCESLAEAGVAAIQAPLPFDDVSGMAAINASLLPVIATEAEHREDMFRALLDAGAVTFLQYCLGLCGGFTGGNANRRSRRSARSEKYAAVLFNGGVASCQPAFRRRSRKRRRCRIPPLPRPSWRSLASCHATDRVGLRRSRRGARLGRGASRAG